MQFNVPKSKQADQKKTLKKPGRLSINFVAYAIIILLKVGRYLIRRREEPSIGMHVEQRRRRTFVRGFLSSQASFLFVILGL